MALMSSASNFTAGTPLSIFVGFPSGTTNPVFVPSSIDYVSYYFQNGTGSGTLTFYSLCADGVYRQLVNPAPVVIASGGGPYDGGFGSGSSGQGPFLGIQVLASITGTVTYGHLLGTTRP